MNETVVNKDYTEKKHWTILKRTDVIISKLDEGRTVVIQNVESYIQELEQ